MKMLKLMLMASAYACIIGVVNDVKRGLQSVSDERHRAATVLQNALTFIVPMSEHKMKLVATNLAKQYFDKVCVCV